MEVREITEKQTWEEFFSQIGDKTFLQSWNWGEFNIKMGRKIWRLGMFEEGILVGVALTIKTEARRGTFLLVPHGPAAKEGKDKQVLESLNAKLRELGKEEGASFVRISPFWIRTPETDSLFAQIGFRKAPIYAEYESSWKLNITPSEEELLAGMRKTTRYLIRQVQKNKDIVISQSSQVADVATFDSLSKAVGQRQGFVPFSKKHTEREVDSFNKDNQVSIFFGSYKGEVVATSLVIFWSGVAFYHQAASLPEHSKLSIPYLLQWEAILEAKRRGCKIYDFWGYVDPIKYPKHPWAGPTLFKMGFGGEPRLYAQTRDMVLGNKYWITFGFETLRKLKRHL